MHLLSPGDRLGSDAPRILGERGSPHVTVRRGSARRRLISDGSIPPVPHVYAHRSMLWGAKLNVTSRQSGLVLLIAVSLILSDSLTCAVALEVSQRRESSLGGPQWHQSIIAERWRKGSRGITHIRSKV